MLYLNSVKVEAEDKSKEFNFNKCCIWMLFDEQDKKEIENLTLTSVVFEFFFCIYKKIFGEYLTLTSVVFEFSR